MPLRFLSFIWSMSLLLDASSFQSPTKESDAAHAGAINRDTTSNNGKLRFTMDVIPYVGGTIAEALGRGRQLFAIAGAENAARARRARLLFLDKVGGQGGIRT